MLLPKVRLVEEVVICKMSLGNQNNVNYFFLQRDQKFVCMIFLNHSRSKRGSGGNCQYMYYLFCLSSRRLDMTVVIRERNGLIKHLTSFRNLFSKLTMLCGCQTLGMAVVRYLRWLLLLHISVFYCVPDDGVVRCEKILILKF